MEYRFEFAPLALRQARAERDWIADQSPERAEKWFRGLFREIESLKSFPRRCPISSESRHFGEEVRELLYGKRRSVYRVFYALRGDVIRVMGVWRADRGSIKP